MRGREGGEVEYCGAGNPCAVEEGGRQDVGGEAGLVESEEGYGCAGHGGR